MIKRMCVIVLCLILSCSLASCGGNSEKSMVGTWVVKEYHDGEETISTKEIGELYGETAFEFNKYSLIFTKSGNLRMISPDFRGGTNEANLSYTVQDGYIEVYDPDNSSKFELVDYKDGKISFEVTSGLTIILTKK